ncbi:MAG: hypothetical protein KME31_18140 [Tolypothrix carrinoi HA7290-LM1]|nr:hypothetical protein [Tolypothrix carrinoi HA7290-LM1]
MMLFILMVWCCRWGRQGDKETRRQGDKEWESGGSFCLRRAEERFYASDV